MFFGTSGVKVRGFGGKLWNPKKPRVFGFWMSGFGFCSGISFRVRVAKRSGFSPGFSGTRTHHYIIVLWWSNVDGFVHFQSVLHWIGSNNGGGGEDFSKFCDDQSTVWREESKAIIILDFKDQCPYQLGNKFPKETTLSIWKNEKYFSDLLIYQLFGYNLVKIQLTSS